jgi:hypothetical protein
MKGKNSMASKKLNETDAAVIKRRLQQSEFQHDVAAEFGVNQGRISEIKSGKRFAQVSPSDNDNDEGPDDGRS